MEYGIKFEIKVTKNGYVLEVDDYNDNREYFVFEDTFSLIRGLEREAKITIPDWKAIDER